MKKLALFVFALVILFACNTNDKKQSSKLNFTKEIQVVNSFMDDWHLAATEANYENYFSKLDTTSIFIGTDAGENWTKQEFEGFSKPYFDNGKAWDFKRLERNIYFSKNASIAWFDELLNTWMGTCRGSGVLERNENGWILKHYVLSVAIPNDAVKDVISVKKEQDDIFLQKFK
ncbi:MAG: nuclear transport factor 2 family protein [Polaribacter sp.]|jgi:hypothetical protein